MGQTLIQPQESAKQAPMVSERRQHARVKVEWLVPVSLGPDNGGIVLNASEGGLRVRMVGPVAPTQVSPLVITPNGKKDPIEASGQIVWTDDSRRGAGVRFTDLSDASQEQIKKWLARNDPARATEQEQPAVEPARTETTPPMPLPAQEREEVADNQIAVSSVPDPTFEDQPEEPGGAFENTVQLDSAAPKTKAVPSEEPYEPWKTYTADSESQSALFQPGELRETWQEKHATPDKAGQDFARRRKFARMAASVALIVLVFCGSAALFLSWQGGSRETPTDEREPIAGEPSPSETDQPPLAAKPLAKTSTSRRRAPAKVQPANIAGPSTPIITDPHGQASSPTKRSAPWQLQVVDLSNQQHSLTLRGGPIVRLRSWATSGRVHVPRVGTSTRADQTPRSTSVEGSMAPLGGAAPKASGGEPEQHLMPDYPPRALQRNIQGTVVLKALVGKDGRVQNVQVLSGPPLLASAVLEAVRAWRYRPFYRNGEPVEFETQVAIEFIITPK
jgi:TonB family protein